jgi:hypothetical protein
MPVFGRLTFLTKMPRELQISIAVMIFNWPMSKTGFEPACRQTGIPGCKVSSVRGLLSNYWWAVTGEKAKGCLILSLESRTP